MLIYSHKKMLIKYAPKTAVYPTIYEQEKGNQRRDVIPDEYIHELIKTWRCKFKEMSVDVKYMKKDKPFLLSNNKLIAQLEMIECIKSGNYIVIDDSN